MRKRTGLQRWIATVPVLALSLVGCSQGAQDQQNSSAHVDAETSQSPSSTADGMPQKERRKGKEGSATKDKVGQKGDHDGSPGKPRGSDKKGVPPANNDAGMPALGPNRQQSSVLEKLPGSEKAGCVAVGDRRDVRSGSMAAGPFDDIRRWYKGGTQQLSDRSVRLYIIPLSSAKMPGVHVTMVEKRTGEKVELTDDHVSDAEDWKLYDIETALPMPGTWIIRAQAGPDSGCWEFDLT